MNWSHEDSMVSQLTINYLLEDICVMAQMNEWEQSYFSLKFDIRN